MSLDLGADLPDAPRDVNLNHETDFGDANVDGFYEDTGVDEGQYTGNEIYNMNMVQPVDDRYVNGMNAPINGGMNAGMNGGQQLNVDNNNGNGNDVASDHKLDALKRQIDTLVQMQSISKNSAAIDNSLMEMQKKPKDSRNKGLILWNVMIFILLAFSIAGNIHYIMFRTPCACFDESDRIGFGNEALNLVGSGSKSPTGAPTVITDDPSMAPTKTPSMTPSETPSETPTMKPSNNPTGTPTKSPSETPTMTPSIEPTGKPSTTPTKTPSMNPTESPTKKPTPNPSYQVSSQSLVPVGTIMLWDNCNQVPNGWQICDGSGSCPDLRGRFVVGGGTSYSYGSTGGSATHNHGVSYSGNSNYHTLTIGQIPAHNHHNGNYKYLLRSDCSQTYDGSSDGTCGEPNLFNAAQATTVGGNGGHRHSISFSTSSTTSSNLPPYYALCYIMKTQQLTWNTYP
eukprot:CAMPEP_0114658150 /NCGR_PEP_ID=MMETSP0191-20121206/15199_1 /TAXON_ID=126664 /ORGANISM="Sorites sp." /LENGTH=454 /DNA_ID=CAMNT_0001879363 /DNA_START=40 /DNA_END=1404 /DNA_ORIENTATION=-